MKTRTRLTVYSVEYIPFHHTTDICTTMQKLNLPKMYVMIVSLILDPLIEHKNKRTHN